LGFGLALLFAWHL